jgi:hypothetical protein
VRGGREGGYSERGDGWASYIVGKQPDPLDHYWAGWLLAYYYPPSIWSPVSILDGGKPPCPYCTLIFEESKLLLLAINKRSERAILDALSVGVLLFSVRT